MSTEYYPVLTGWDATRQTAGSVPEDVLSVGLDNTGRHLHSLISGSGNVVIVSWEVIAVASISGEWLSCSVLSGRPRKVVDVCSERWKAPGGRCSSFRGRPKVFHSHGSFFMVDNNSVIVKHWVRIDLEGWERRWNRLYNHVTVHRSQSS